MGLLDLGSKTCEGIKNTVGVLHEMQRRRPPRAFHVDRVLRPFSMDEARAQSMLGLCKLRTAATPAPHAAHAPPGSPLQEFYVDHFKVAWTTRYATPGTPLVLLVTSGRVVLGVEETLRPLWEVSLERIARVELKEGHVMLWTWEQVGVGIGFAQSTQFINLVVERSIL